MRHIVLTVALLLCTSQVEGAILFTPDEFSLTIEPVFDQTGTNTFCWQCGDADPLNDFHAVWGPFPDVISAEWNQFFAYAGGTLDLQSTTPTYEGLEANFALHATFTASGMSLPQSLVKPSVSFALIPGRILGVNDGVQIVLECCDGFVGPLEIRQAFFPSTPFVVPPGGHSGMVALELHPFANQIFYTPAVPEPTSLLLLGSALTGAALRRRRAKTHKR